MSVQFVVSEKEVQVDCYSHLNLLAHAQMEEVQVGSRCGGHGICGGDRIQILSGSSDLSPITSAEKEHLSPEEIAQGWRLACQCWPEKDSTKIRVEVRPIC